MTTENNPIIRNTWKQPIPSTIPELAGDPLGELLFVELLRKSANTDREVTLDDGSIIFLKRGQVIFGRNKWGRKFGMTPKCSIKLFRKLVKLEKVNNLLNKQKSRNCTIVTIRNYDNWVTFEQTNEQSVNKQRTNSEQTVNTYNSIKSVKNEEIEKNNGNGIVSTEDGENNSVVVPLRGNMSGELNTPLTEKEMLLRTRFYTHPIVSYYFKCYLAFKGEHHPTIVPAEQLRILDVFDNAEDVICSEVSPGDWQAMIDHFFYCNPIKTDHNIVHFTSGEVIEKRWWESAYNGCPKCFEREQAQDDTKTKSSDVEAENTDDEPF